MPRYNILVLARHTMPREELKNVVKRCCAQVLENGGLVESIDNYGRKQLAYRIGQPTGQGPRVSASVNVALVSLKYRLG